jgi:Ca2+-binding RTX toxin-like protein
MVSIRKVGKRTGKPIARGGSVALSAILAMSFLPLSAAPAQAASVGSGFVVNAADLAFILKQIKISEQHAATATAANPCGTLVGNGPNQIPDPLTPYGLRTVDGSCNNLVDATRGTLAAADQPFPRLTTPEFKPAEGVGAGFFGPGSPAVPSSSYAQKDAGNSVFDSQPRVISNLIVDQTSSNPAAVAAAGFPVRTQGAAGVAPCGAGLPTATPPVPPNSPGCVPDHETLFIPNVTTDVGLSPPYNSLFTFFGQFFDHGVDQTVKSGGTVYVPLKDDDPLIAGPDHIFGNADDLSPNLRFMALTRAQNQPGPDGILGNADDITDANNTDTPWVDQSQTYSSHSSHQVFMREYALVDPDGAGPLTERPVSTGSLLGGSGNQAAGLAPWSAIKAQAASKLGLRLTDRDVLNIPTILSDAYGKFIPGPARGMPQYVTASGLVEGNLAAPVPVPADVRYFDTPFLVDIAHNADPSPQDTDHNPATPAVFPTPDTNTTASADFAHQEPGTYDDELLDSHFICGDGRCNENVALSAIHQVFHSEHDRLVADIKNTINGLTGTANTDWHLASGADGWNGERLFQAARFVTEMEYQHLVFEEFARKVQPAVRPFHVYSPDINPAINAEFAAAVYRFGHSMLDQDVARTNPDGSDNSLPLLTAFLNPPTYTRTGPGDCANDAAGVCSGAPTGGLSSQEAAGAVIMGSSNQVGNELDEFVTDTLRNNLLGLPLDLPTLNMTRARDVGIPSLNNVRRQIHARTNDAQLTPYTSWVDYGQNLKHPESLINFVAAYGKHPTITGETTLAGKREAARKLVDPILGTDVPPADAADFLNSAGTWANNNTGIDDVDLWVGGLAEKTNLFGGLLGSTFNYVFQTQLEDLQDGDRLYYLNRTQGMNLRTQLEGNSFSELIGRNTAGTHSLKADAFATADCKFELANLDGTPAGYAAQGASVTDDPSTECNETLLLLRKPDGTIQYKEKNTVDPPGINGQSVYNGTVGADRVYGGNDNDTFWGDAGNDKIEGNGGDDVALGGEGNDIITDLSGADVLKGGPGNDAIDSGIGDDITMGGEGQDVVNGGANDNEHFAGPGNDFVIAGQGADTVFGDSGDDWIQGGSGQDLLQGDHGAAFFDDPGQTKPGNDVMIGQVGENDYDSEGGDDIMAQNAAIDRNAGSGGFDWAIHQYNTIPANDDMMINNNLAGVANQVVVNRDRWQETEADSGYNLNDTIKGTDGALATPALVGGAGFIGCDALDQAGIDRIPGLNQLVTPALLAAQTTTAASVAAISAPGQCPLEGNVWGDGDILIGGLGSDRLEGRTGNEILDGDRYLTVRISIRDAAGAELGTATLMEAPITASPTGTPLPANLAGKTLQQAVFDGTVDPGNLVAVKEIVTPTTTQANAAAGGNVDTAVFNDTLGAATISAPDADGVTVVTSADGVDRVSNVERLEFSDRTVTRTASGSFVGGTITTTVPVGSLAPAAATIGTPVAGNAQVTVNWTAPAAAANTPAVTGYVVRAFAGTTLVSTTTVGNVTSTVIGSLTNGTAYTFDVTAVNPVGPGPASARSAAVTPVAPVTAPDAPAIGTATAGNATATVTWTAPANGGSPITGYTVERTNGATVVLTNVPVSTSFTATGLANGTAYSFRVRAVNAVGAGAFSAASNTVVPVAPTAPGVPTIGTATAGNASAVVRWTPPASNGGSAIIRYDVQVLNNANAQVGAIRQAAGAATSTLTVTGLVNGVAVHFRVRAVNAIGSGAQSGNSNTVTPITVPGAPLLVVAARGGAGNPITATITWVAPTTTGGSPITQYQITRQRLNANGSNNGAATVSLVPGTTRQTVFTAPAGVPPNTNYRFTVQAVNAAGTGDGRTVTSTVR